MILKTTPYKKEGFCNTDEMFSLIERFFMWLCQRLPGRKASCLNYPSGPDYLVFRGINISDLEKFIASSYKGRKIKNNNNM